MGLPGTSTGDGATKERVGAAYDGAILTCRLEVVVTRRLTTWSILAAVMVAVVLGAYVLGTLNPAVHVSNGIAYSNGGNQSVGGSVSTAEATVMADGWAYGMDGGVSQWEDTGGAWHDGGWPSCLSTLGDHQIRFGWVSVSTPGGAAGLREVVWVECP